MRAHPVVWALRAAWLILPFTVGDSLSGALDGRSTPVVVVVATLGWTVWAAVLVASLVAHPVALTVLRVLAPAAPLAAVAALTVWAPDEVSSGHLALGAAGVAAALVAATAALSGATADDYVDGASYGAERRFALRVPVAFLMGPVPVFWVLLVGGCTVGPILLAARQWVAGSIVTAVGLAAAVPATKAFHALSRRWLVFVPAGATLIDHLGLVDPVLFPAKRITSFGPALAGTTATDLTRSATGLVLEITFDAPVEVTARTSKSEGEVELVRAVLVSPARPGAVVVEAASRGLPTPTSG